MFLGSRITIEQQLMDTTKNKQNGFQQTPRWLPLKFEMAVTPNV